MNNKKETVKYSELFIRYQNLFTKKQRTYLQDYYLKDLSLQEIAKKYHISVTAIADSIKRSKNKLNNYEQKLKLYAKSFKRLKIYNKIVDNSVKIELIEIDKLC
ncbi:MAG: hypothetical protein LBP70_02195 [Mycoplasmataceae bacterium]|jgi:predicted DNA-binding protein YlxM (UPF0122 family)|nr:hypothetical protein [Mycoplasmataceae bacterium]